MFKGRRSQGASDLSRITTDHEERLRRLETIEKGVIPFQFHSFTGLRGLWMMSGIEDNGDPFDFSGGNHTLTYNGNPLYNYDGLAPYIQFDGVGDCLDHVNDPHYDILGTETYIAPAARGLTMGGWWYFDRLATEEAEMGKWNTVGNQRSYLLEKDVGNTVTMHISSTGADDVSQVSGAITTGQWYFIVGRFDPSTTIDIFINSAISTLAAGVPAAINNSTARIDFGAHNNGAASFLQGRASMNFICAAQLSDVIIRSMYQQSRSMFGV